MEELDKPILQKIQIIADWIQAWSGKNNFFWARVLFNLSFIISCIKVDGNYHPSIVIGFLQILNCLFAVGNTISTFIYESICRNSPSFKNPAEFEKIHLIVRFLFFVHWLSSFLTFVWMLVSNEITVGFFISFISISCATWGFYLSACTPKPPRKSKFKKIVEKVKERVIAKLAPQAIPA